LIDNALVDEVWSLLQKQYYGDLPQGREITYAALSGLVASLGDPHTSFLDPKNADIFNSDIEGEFEGIGAYVAQAPGGGVLITYVFPGQPAEQAGIRVDDVVVGVDGRDVTRLPLTDAISRIRGPRDSKVVLTIEREGQAPVDVTVTRARIEIPTITTKTLGDGKIAYIALADFSTPAAGRLSDALTTALAQNPAGLILDLRGNPGGLLDSAVTIGSYFVPDGNILLERTRDGTERAYPRTGAYFLGNTPLVVLIDAGSASASEIVAGAIQDAGTGVLMGERSYGKGSVQLPNTLSDGSQLRVTIAHWFTPKDRAIDKVGLAPDYVVPVTSADAEAKRDSQLDAAVRYLLGDRTGLQTPTPGITRVPVEPAGTPAP
jgi:carboxyl-terminal processing protease